MNRTNLTDIYIINPAYKIVSDIKRCIIINNNSGLLGNKWDENENITTGFSWKIHPYIAYIFSFFDGKENLENTIKKIVEVSELELDYLYSIFLKFIENEEVIYIDMINHNNTIPKNFLIKKEQNVECNNIIDRNDIIPILKDVDLTSMRNFIPNSMTIMVTNTCVTDCVYCYADTTHKIKNHLTLNRIEEIITEAYSLGMNDVEIGGGDIFCYKYWKELLPILRKYNYSPYISTKFPLTEEIVDGLKANKVKGIQLSLDSVDNKEIQKMLNVDSHYLEKVKKGINLLNEAQIEITVKPAITKFNDSEISVKKLLEYLSSIKMVKYINIAPASYSGYKPFVFSSTIEKIDKIREIAKDFENKTNIRTNVQGGNIYYDQEKRMERLKNSSICSGNLSSFYVLADGKVTLCEQLYWHPFFILGDLSTQSIMEVWNGEKALSLWNIKQEEIQESSPCKTCSAFEACRRGKGTCWRMAIVAYGDDKYDYPGPDCPLAPDITRPFFMPEN